MPEDFGYMPRDFGEIVRLNMMLPRWGLIDRIALRCSGFTNQDKPTPEQGQMNELNDEEIWKQMKPQTSTVTAGKAALATTPTDLVYDSVMRSTVKAMGWRLTAGIVTGITSLFFTGGNWMVAASMVGSDFASKSVTMFIGERLWNKSNVGRSKTQGETAMRSVMKAVAWRLFAVCNTLVVGLLFAKSLSVASKIASTDAIIKTGLMVIYERIWNRINWGRMEGVQGGGI